MHQFNEKCRRTLIFDKYAPQEARKLVSFYWLIFGDL